MRSGQPLTGLKFAGRAGAADRQAGRSRGRARRGRHRHLSRQRQRSSRRANGISCIEGEARGTRDVHVAQPRHPELRDIAMHVDARLFALREGPRARASTHIDLAVEGVSCAGCMAKIERGLSAHSRRHAGPRQPTDRRVALEWKAGHARSGPLHRSARRARLQGLSVRDRERGSDGGRAVALPAALPRRRRLRHHERDDAVDPGLVRQRLATCCPSSAISFTGCRR